MAETRICMICDGRGKYHNSDDEYVTCKNCNGTGKVEVSSLPRPGMFEDDDAEQKDYWGV